MEKRIYSVSAINEYIKLCFDENRAFSNICVIGEISNYKLYPSGHHYFSLKDEESTLSCVMFKGNASSLKFHPSNGMSVVAVGRISVFERDGKYQLYCNYLMPAGAGNLQLAYEKLRASLEEEGLFDSAHKKKLPLFPAKIALVTSPVGAAVRDMIRILGTRWPMAQVTVVPVHVQGEEAAEEIADAIKSINRSYPVDLIITGRGGGSAEDLWCFNDERVARAIYASAIPVISAVGHEPDITISDYVADKRASTPSNAAEIAVPAGDEIRSSLNLIYKRIQTRVHEAISEKRNELERYSSMRILKDPHEIFNYRRLLLDSIRDSVIQSQTKILSEKKQELIKVSAAIDAMSPLKVLTRGYSFVSDKSGKTVKSAAELNVDDRIVLNFSDGVAECKVMNRELK